MVRRSTYLPLLVASSILLSGETLGLSTTKFGTRSSTITPLTISGAASKFLTKKKAKAGVSKTRLTSTYVESRHIPKPLFWLPSFVRKPMPMLRASKFLRKRSSIRLICATILAAIVIFGPAFSPARAASTVSASTSTARGLSPAVMPFSSQSRALGTFNFIPSKAELELCFRLLYAACSGAFIGLERSSADRPAGLRTMALVGLGACTYTICSTHGFLPHLVFGCAPNSPILDNVKCDLSRMAANIASGVGFIGAGAIHKSKLHGNGSEAQNAVAGLTTAAAIWVSAAVGIASAVGLYFVGAVSTFSTVAILKYAKVPKEDDEPGFDWKPKPLDIVEDSQPRSSSSQKYSPPASSHQDALSGPLRTRVVSGYDPEENAFVDHEIVEGYSKGPHPIIIKEVFDPRFEQYLQSQFGTNKEGTLHHQEPQREPKSKVLIEEEQEVINVTDSEQDSSIEH